MVRSLLKTCWQVRFAVCRKWDSKPLLCLNELPQPGQSGTEGMLEVSMRLHDGRPSRVSTVVGKRCELADASLLGICARRARGAHECIGVSYVNGSTTTTTPFLCLNSPSSFFTLFNLSHLFPSFIFSTRRSFLLPSAVSRCHLNVHAAIQPMAWNKILKSYKMAPFRMILDGVIVSVLFCNKESTLTIWPAPRMSKTVAYQKKGKYFVTF